MGNPDLDQLEASLFDGAWDDGRPKRWPTLQLRVRGQAFDVYCDHPSDVTLDGYGIPVVCGRTATRDELRNGWVSALSHRPTGALGHAG
jgi:hypothetical protein